MINNYFLTSVCNEGHGNCFKSRGQMVRITIKYTQKASVKSNSAFTDLTLKYNKKNTKQNDRFSFKKMLTLKRFCEWSNEMLHIPTALRSFLFFSTNTYRS